jgi:hypothetical protein
MISQTVENAALTRERGLVTFYNVFFVKRKTANIQLAEFSRNWQRSGSIRMQFVVIGNTIGV